MITYATLLDCWTHTCNTTAELMAEDIPFLEIRDGRYKLVTDTTLAGPLTLL